MSQPEPESFTHVQRQFWRESELRWVNHVNIIMWGPDKDEPTRWRNRTITETTSYGDWEDGKNES